MTQTAGSRVRGQESKYQYSTINVNFQCNNVSPYILKFKWILTFRETRSRLTPVAPTGFPKIAALGHQRQKTIPSIILPNLVLPHPGPNPITLPGLRTSLRPINYKLMHFKQEEYHYDLLWDWEIGNIYLSSQICICDYFTSQCSHRESVDSRIEDKKGNKFCFVGPEIYVCVCCEKGKTTQFLEMRCQLLIALT